MHEIQTDRLRLLALSVGQLRLCRDAAEELEQELGFPLARGVVTAPVRRAIGMKLSKMAVAKVSSHRWITYWLIVAEGPAGAGPVGIGLVGFKGIPDGSGEVEIGYGIDPDYRNRGYATEAVQAMIAWAFEEPRCRAIIAPDTPRINAASNRVLAKAGMTIYAQTDEALSWRIGRDDLRTL